MTDCNYEHLEGIHKKTRGGNSHLSVSSMTAEEDGTPFLLHDVLGKQ